MSESHINVEAQRKRLVNGYIICNTFWFELSVRAHEMKFYNQINDKAEILNLSGTYD